MIKVDLDLFFTTTVALKETPNKSANVEFLQDMLKIFNKYEIDFLNLNDVLQMVKQAYCADLMSYGKIWEHTEIKESKKVKFSLSRRRE